MQTLGTCIVHITGTSQVASLKKTPDAIAIIVHNSNPPYTEICRTIARKLRFNSAMIAHDRREEVEHANESLVVMHTGDFNDTPCAMVKLQHSPQN